MRVVSSGDFSLLVVVMTCFCGNYFHSFDAVSSRLSFHADCPSVDLVRRGGVSSLLSCRTGII